MEVAIISSGTKLKSMHLSFAPKLLKLLLLERINFKYVSLAIPASICGSFREKSQLQSLGTCKSWGPLASWYLCLASIRMSIIMPGSTLCALIERAYVPTRTCRTCLDREVTWQRRHRSFAPIHHLILCCRFHSPSHNASNHNTWNVSKWTFLLFNYLNTSSTLPHPSLSFFYWEESIL